MAATTYAAIRILNSLLGGASPSTPNFGALTGGPTHLGAALDTATPGEDGTGFNEPPSADGYARVALTLPGDFTVPSATADPMLIENAAAITFPAAINNAWGTITHVGFFDASTGGNLILLLALTTNRVIAVGEALNFAAGELEVTAD